jgi:hypothetical protein
MDSPDEAEAPALIDIIRASLCYYRAKYAHEIPAVRAEIELAGEAARLDPGFADYVLYWCRLLVMRAWPGDLEEAATQLRALALRSVRLLEILDLCRHLPPAMQGAWYEELEERAARLWSSVEMRSNHPDPVLRTSAETSARSRACGPLTATAEVP